MAKTAQKAKEILVTGFPNFTALKLIQKLAETEKKSKLNILVMEKYISYANSLLTQLTKSARKRVRIYSGDVVFLDLGLSGKEFGELCEKTTHIYHLAHIWQLGVPGDYCREVNINGARNLLDFAMECGNLEQLAYFSTIYVSGKRNGVIREDEFDKKQKFKNEWEKSHFDSEKLARKYYDKGLPITFFRLGYPIGESETGEIIKFDGPLSFVKYLLTIDGTLPLFLPGMAEGPSNLVPVDYIVNSCSYVIDNIDSTGKTYHITDPFPLTARSVFDSVCSYLGLKQPTYGLPRRLFRAVFFIPGMEKLGGIPREMFDYLNHKAVHNCSNTLSALKGSGITCPRFDAYFPIAIEYARDLLKRSIEKQEEAETYDPFDRLRP